MLPCVTIRCIGRISLLAGLLSVVLMPDRGVAESIAHEAEQFFETKVRPLLVAKCQECHGPEISEAGLRLDSRGAMLRGSDSGPVVVPGDAAKSRLVHVIKHADEMAMPPDEKLSGEEIATLEQWVSIGVPWTGPGGEAASPPTRAEAMAERIVTARDSHWSLQPAEAHQPPPIPESLPASLRSSWSANRIDRFVVGRMAKEGITPADPAAASSLIRRLSYDLTGLPPTAAAADAFAADPSEAAYQKLVDQFLASTEHAEHWARHWLDLARYADTIGYAFGGQSAKYPYAWTYRDWVVRALHQDLPYNQFVTLQLAADRLEPPVPLEDLAALGFLTVGRTFRGNTHDIIDDRIDLVTRGLLGLTVACARCHDHKYEPIGTDDYYALYGIFASCESPQELPVIGKAPPGPEADAFAKKLAELKKELTDHEDAVYERAVREAVAHAADYFLEVARPAPRPDGRPPKLADGYELEQLVIDRLKRLLQGAKPTDKLLGPWATLAPRSDAEIAKAAMDRLAEQAAGLNRLVLEELQSANPQSLRELAEAYGRLAMRVAPESAGGPVAPADEPQAMADLRRLFGEPGTPLIPLRTEAMRVAKRSEGDKRRALERKVINHRAEAPGGPPRAMVLADRPKPVDSPVFLRGNPGRRGDVQKRRLPVVLGGAEVDRGSSGRLDLARAIVAADNPLTPRVLVNWVWTHHFGRGLVETPGDFGLRGESPSHPALLDDLAHRFVTEGNWSLRWLHREIVLSQTWRQSSFARPETLARDPDNHLFSRAQRRRLSWEAWRDSLLVSAGTLTPDARGGPGGDPLDAKQLTRRTLYTWLDRQDVPGILRTFDIASPDTAVHVRPQTTVPQQGLVALNAPLVVAVAKQVAARSAQEAGEASSTSTRLTTLWRAVLARNPTDREQVMARAWLNAHGDSTLPEFGPWPQLAQALLATAEFQYVD
jgi:cytochrome c553